MDYSGMMLCETGAGCYANDDCVSNNCMANVCSGASSATGGSSMGSSEGGSSSATGGSSSKNNCQGMNRPNGCSCVAMGDCASMNCDMATETCMEDPYGGSSSGSSGGSGYSGPNCGKDFPAMMMCEEGAGCQGDMDCSSNYCKNDKGKKTCQYMGRRTLLARAGEKAQQFMSFGAPVKEAKVDPKIRQLLNDEHADAPMGLPHGKNADKGVFSDGAVPEHLIGTSLSQMGKMNSPAKLKKSAEAKAAHQRALALKPKRRLNPKSRLPKSLEALDDPVHVKRRLRAWHRRTHDLTHEEREAQSTIHLAAAGTANQEEESLLLLKWVFRGETERSFKTSPEGRRLMAST